MRRVSRQKAGRGRGPGRQITAAPTPTVNHCTVGKLQQIRRRRCCCTVTQSCRGRWRASPILSHAASLLMSGRGGLASGHSCPARGRLSSLYLVAACDTIVGVPSSCIEQSELYMRALYRLLRLPSALSSLAHVSPRPPARSVTVDCSHAAVPSIVVDRPLSVPSLCCGVRVTWMHAAGAQTSTLQYSTTVRHRERPLACSHSSGESDVLVQRALPSRPHNHTLRTCSSRNFILRPLTVAHVVVSIIAAPVRQLCAWFCGVADPGRRSRADASFHEQGAKSLINAVLSSYPPMHFTYHSTVQLSLCLTTKLYRVYLARIAINTQSNDGSNLRSFVSNASTKMPVMPRHLP